MLNRILRGTTQCERVKHRRVIMASLNNSLPELSLCVITWNLADITPDASDIESLFLPQDGVTTIGTAADILVIGLQEAPHTVSSVIGTDHLVEMFGHYLGPKQFVCVTYSRMSITPGLWGLLTMVFVRAPILCYIKEVDVLVTRTGVGGFVGNKGASTIRFVLGSTSMCFINCHLVPHPEHNMKRTQEIKHILETQYFERSLTSHFTLDMHVLGHDILFLFGDLNFRLEGKNFSDVKKTLTDDNGIDDLLKFDQLQLEQEKGAASDSHLHYFMEAPITFFPSYKFEPNTDNYTDGGKERAPAWCDRILWRVHKKCLPKPDDPNPTNLLTFTDYNLHRLPRISDHKAVSASFKLNIDLESLTPPVVFHLNEWRYGFDSYIFMDIQKDTTISGWPWDWIGLYPRNITHLNKDYVTYVYSPAPRGKLSCTSTFKARMSGNSLPKTPGFYRLIYISRAQNCVLGMSPLFYIKNVEDY